MGSKWLNKMIWQILAVCFLQSTTTIAAPIQQLLQQLHKLTQQQMQPLQGIMQQRIPLQEAMIPMLQPQGILQQPIPMVAPLHGTVQQQRLALQEQMYALQQFQALQRMNLVPSPVALNTPPVLILFSNNELDVRPTDININKLKYQNPEEMGDEDSEVVDAEPQETNANKNIVRAVLLMPNTRAIIGDIISSIPFLPIEINVPDTISWIYNGIASIISGIGQNLPFRPQTSNSETQNGGNVKSIWNQMKKQHMPIVVIPL